MQCSSSAVHVDLVSEGLGVSQGQTAVGVEIGWCRCAIISSCSMQTSGAGDFPLCGETLGDGVLISKE